ncbi:choice-of-anchor C family protein [Streptosporangium sp. NPDC004631]
MTVTLTRGRRPARLATAVLALSACSVLTAPGAQAASGPILPISNGGFETPVITGQAYYDTGTGIGAWNVTAGSVDLIGPGGPWSPARGRQSLDLSGNRPGTIEQTFATTVGRCYTVSFALAGNTYGLPVVKTGYAKVTQGTLTTQKDFTFDTTGKTPQNMGYVRERFTFCARDTRATLSLVSTTDGVYGPAVDDVVVIPRPRCIGIGLDLGVGGETSRED